MNPRTPFLLALLALALLVPASAGAAVERSVSVTADATLKIANDSAGFGFSVSKERRTRGAALRAVSSGLRGVIAAVQAVPGVEDGGVTTGRISVRKTFRGEKAVYRASEGISVVLHQPDKAGDLVSAAIAAGATGLSGPNFFVGDTETAFSQALAAAFAKAKAQATTLAAQAGATLGPALLIDEGEGAQLIPQSDSEFSAPAAKGCATTGPTTTETTSAGPTTASKRVSRCAGAAPPPTKPGTSTVTATVHVIFALQ
jgi:uncharacterized protein YggE